MSQVQTEPWPLTYALVDAPTRIFKWMDQYLNKNLGVRANDPFGMGPPDSAPPLS